LVIHWNGSNWSRLFPPVVFLRIESAAQATAGYADAQDVAVTGPTHQKQDEAALDLQPESTDREVAFMQL
ncbi:hypothetical protein, partial [Sporolactobacillus putidus]|uniref:hypothetical protein n=1 Tax=Sporolactobacillus putidus TaxID=492735 RepID=UPI001E37A25C